MRNKRGIVPIALGVLLLLMALGLTGYNLLEDSRASASAEHAFRALRVQTPDPSAEETPDYILPVYQVAPEIEMPVTTVEEYDYIGYLEIPALGLDLPVMDSWSYPQLKLSPCRYEGSAYTDDLIIAAHNYQRHFGRLKNLSPGDAVYFTDAEGNRFAYEVAALEQLRPNQGREMRAGDWDLTLFTCTVGGQQRVTVRCLRTDRAAA